MLKFSWAEFKTLLSQNYPVLSILVGFLLVALSLGPYQNGDTTWEFNAVSGVLKYGLPYANGFYLIDQPPIGFYIQAAFSKVAGLSIANGAFLVTLFGVGCIILVYVLGKALYNRTTGVFAAALFAFSPWNLILSRAFLIDVQCLFFSLLTLFVGLIAVKRGSFKLFLVSSVVFAVAFNTKLYAVFCLIPLLALFLIQKPTLKRIATWLAGFSVVPFLASFLWYVSITGLGLSTIVFHPDFIVHEPVGIAPSYFFVSNFLISYGIGWFFVDAIALSLLVCLVFRGQFRNFLVLDIICLVTVSTVVAVNTFLGATLDLKSPYQNAIKYNYQALPFFSLLAASLVSKGVSLFQQASQKKKKIYGLVALVGFVLVGAAIVYNMSYVHLFSTWDYLVFRVEPGVNVGYSLISNTPIDAGSLMMNLQILGFGFVLSGVVWLSRKKLVATLRWLKNFIDTTNKEPHAL